MKKQDSISIASIIIHYLLLLLPISKSYSQGRVQIGGTAGIEYSKLEWNIAGDINGANPNIFSELEWTELKGVIYSVQTGYNTSKISYFLRSSFSSNINGFVKDTDYASDNRTDPKYSETFKSTGGRNFAGETGIRFPLKISAVPIVLFEVGLKYKEQRLFIDHSLEGVQSGYNSRWTGLFVGFNREVNIGGFAIMSFTLAMDLSHYYGLGNWILRTELSYPKSFVHEAVSYGFNSSAKTQLHLSKRLSLIALLQGWYADSFKGKDILYFRDEHSVATQLNSVKALGSIVQLGLEVTF